MVTVRKALSRDFEEIYKLEEEFRHYNNSIEPNKFLHYRLNKNGFKKDFLEVSKEKNIVFLVLANGSKLDGFFIGKLKSISSRGFVYNSKWMGYIENVFISKRYRGKGYLDLFLKEFFKVLKRNKIEYCSLHTDASNKLAIGAYIKLGFKGPIQYKFFRMLK